MGVGCLSACVLMHLSCGFFKVDFLQVVSTKYISAYKYYYRNLYSVYVAYLIGVLLSPSEL